MPKSTSASGTTKLSVFRRQAAINDHVTLRLTRGEDVSGRVQHLDDEYICLDCAGRATTVFADILAGWEIHSKHSSAARPADHIHSQRPGEQILEPDHQDQVQSSSSEPVAAEAAQIDQAVPTRHHRHTESPVVMNAKPRDPRHHAHEYFQHLDNPYSPFAEGGPVDKPEMFVGRDDFLDRLESSLLSGSRSKSIVVFGQKRAGKSSLLEHLRRRLAENGSVVPVYFSLQDLAPELSVQAFLHRILQGIAEVLEEFQFDGRDVPEFSPPKVDELNSHATLRFHDSIAALVRVIKRRSTRITIVLLVDEFTDIFKAIKRKQIPREFMKAWKSIIEKRYFASVLVGQDIMPDFKAEFPNEFGVTEDERVTYLDESAAEILVQEPIGRERFAGRAVQQLLELTACSPYYTMMFCARLVDYMNSTRSVIVTEADILTVEAELLQGDRRLTRDKFDNLLSAGDSILDSGIDPDDTYHVCRSIAQGLTTGEWCSRTAIGGFSEPDLSALLLDLETRDVLERNGDAYRLRVGLFRDWLLLQD